MRPRRQLGLLECGYRWHEGISIEDAFTAVPLDRNCCYLRCSWDDSRFHVYPLYGLSVGGRSPSWLVNLNSYGRGKRSSARPGPLSWYQSLPHIHSTPLPPPTPDSIPSRSITLPYRQYHGVMLAQFQTRRLTSSRAEISRQLKAKRNCHRQPQAMETTANMPSGRETALFISAC